MIDLRRASAILVLAVVAACAGRRGDDHGTVAQRIGGLPVVGGELAFDDSVDAPQAGKQGAGGLAFDGATYVYAYTNNIDPSGSGDVYVTRIRASDGAFLDGIGFKIGRGMRPSVTYDGASTFLIAWTGTSSSSSVEGVRFTTSGGVAGGVTALAQVSDQRISFDGLGFVIVGTAFDPAAGFANRPFLTRWSPADLAQLAPRDGVWLQPVAGTPTAAVVTSTLDGATGASLVAWQENVGTNSRIYAARVATADGTVLDKPAILVKQGPATSRLPAVASNGVDEFAIAWDTNDTPGTTNIEARRIARATGASPDATPILLATSVFQQRLYYHGAGKYGLLLNDSVGTQRRVLFDSAAGPVTTIPKLTGHYAATIVKSPGVIAFASGDAYTSNNQDAYFFRVDDDLNPIDPGPKLIGLPNTQWTPRVGNAGAYDYAVWLDNRDTAGTQLYGARLDRTTRTVIGPVVKLSTYIAGESAPSTPVFDGSRIVVARTNAFGTGEFSWVDPATGTVISSFYVADGSATWGTSKDAPSVRCDARRCLFAWVAPRDGGQHAVHVRRLDHVNRRWLDSSPILAQPAATDVLRNVRVVSDGAKSLVAWYADGPGGRGLRAARIDETTGALLDPPTLIDAYPADFTEPRLAYGAGKFLAAWGWDDGTHVTFIDAASAPLSFTSTLLPPAGAADITHGTIPAAFDGTQFVLARSTQAGDVVAMRITPAGLLVDAFPIADDAIASEADGDITFGTGGREGASVVYARRAAGSAQSRAKARFIYEDPGTPDAGADASADAGDDASADAGGDAGADAGTDAGANPGTDAGADSGTDAGADAGADAGTDSGADAGTDAGADAGADAGTDSGTDAGADAGSAPRDAGTVVIDGGKVPSRNVDASTGPAPSGEEPKPSLDGDQGGCACDAAVGSTHDARAALAFAMVGLVVLRQRRRPRRGTGAHVSRPAHSSFGPRFYEATGGRQRSSSMRSAVTRCQRWFSEGTFELIRGSCTVVAPMRSQAFEQAPVEAGQSGSIETR